MTDSISINYQELAEKIKVWGKELGFSQIGISDIDLSSHQQALENWLDKGYQGGMDYMQRHQELRANPEQLLPGTIRVISARMDYLIEDAKFASTLNDANKAYISRYALGRDYHKLMRNRLKKLGEKIEAYCQQLNFRPFVDSAPVLERPLAEKAGLGWVGKHSLLINKEAGSWFFLGELLVDIPLPQDNKSDNQCGSCVACIKICPTQAIVEPYVVDARRCISYLTIELRDAIPIEFRPLLGNRIYGCDDCQLVCPWNKFGQLSSVDDFKPRNNFDSVELLALFAWNEQQFLDNTQGSPIRRIGFECWQRNIAVALGNAPHSAHIVTALQQSDNNSAMVQEHIDWALSQQSEKQQRQQGESRLTARLIRTIEKGLPRDA
ncbi:tRNA epoxyqueuosine(34) reductase QueG [Thalassotalea sp. Y01]|uniref:tRNA epoxyqueuosine(34) reductase QueG n=1 Tax=Thalassotalea sp. Y01 TaxID=2729613 RepID=UPI00145F8097|nr:tRNA epoxyqueuosine(34) reductase QueG [Thalassotalea sp. Y01]NMP17019.1 tRNA epoxyqueuosine(34) reductase QueG [Thalassotalea sp. Y01]